ncbi:SH3 domain-containing protein [Bacillus sp. FJAT-49736]|uniref:SH3 domain-containing protein n=1 Tax=Bacillus sp. FJAT-49736 TaxID=2833582 RepID=UPI001BC93DE7|nr:SH3 domain-containing protein [Bacillus sp. FJAT-49736]MBS4173659.1 SH3 domain-containing protein [Bacillus sp. FJAT-49736]
MGRKFIIILLTLIFLGAGFDYPEHKVNAETEKAIVNVSVLNIRKGPGLSYPILKQVKKGDQFNVVQKKNDWYELKLPSGETGWAASWLISLTKTKALTATSGVVTVNGLRLRSEPSSDSSILKVLQENQDVTIDSQNGNWLKISVAGINGWVSKDFVTINQQKTSVKLPSSKGIVTVDHLNIRTSPSISASTIGMLNTGNKINILEEMNGWIHFSLGTQAGWVSSQYIEKIKSSNGNKEISANQSTQKATGSVNVNSLNVRSTPSLNGKIIGSISQGQSFAIVKEQNNWIEIKLKNNQVGWIAGWYVNKSTANASSESNQKAIVTILYNGTNLRSDATTNSTILARGNAGDTFTILNKVNDWYKIQLTNGGIAFVASWLISSNYKTSSPSVTPSDNASTKTGSGIKGKTIIIDPGHGGQDNGTSGYRGTLEKNLTLSTAMKLYQKLKNAGANVILTRNDDHYVSLPARVGISENNKADAFISIHFDSLKEDPSVTGHTTYYYHDNQRALANEINQAISSQTSIKDRGVRFGDFHVIRENNIPAVLAELGYLSNPNEELLINTEQYQELVTTSIYNGFVRYFK